MKTVDKQLIILKTADNHMFLKTEDLSTENDRIDRVFLETSDNHIALSLDGRQIITIKKFQNQLVYLERKKFSKTNRWFI